MQCALPGALPATRFLGLKTTQRRTETPARPNLPTAQRRRLRCLRLASAQGTAFRWAIAGGSQTRPTGHARSGPSHGLDRTHLGQPPTPAPAQEVETTPCDERRHVGRLGWLRVLRRTACGRVPTVASEGLRCRAGEKRSLAEEPSPDSRAPDIPPLEMSAFSAQDGVWMA